ncbi:hypothetical protein HZS61_006495 [Fusarium oxysporum f. sp. conglutinans]|uniref:BED-type domain-containing protein n=1 Tax=Fusarium oxysporum f. sp. conglutinans TaxID=100902 RepID=A0A8H6G9P1_FUSOX|nr:hypothetical protein HZS61_006495 [Fusarium oxysporum f. sp. conglutinans]
MDAVADSIVVTSEDACPRDSSMRKSDRPRKLTAKGMENLSGNVGIVMQALIREVRDETMKQMAKAQQETVKEITTSHERIIETLWNAWKKEQQALKQMIEGQEKAIRQLQQDIQGIQAQAAQERKLMQEQIDELKRMQQHAPRDIESLQVQASEEIKRIHEKLDIMAQHAVAGSARTNPRQSFADIARMSPTEGQNGGVRGPEVVSSPTPPLSSPGEDLFCTIDISGVGDDDRNQTPSEPLGSTLPSTPTSVSTPTDILVLDDGASTPTIADERQIPTSSQCVFPINWDKIRYNGKPVPSIRYRQPHKRTLNSKLQPSAIYKHGAQLTTDGDNKYWLCKYCHIRGHHHTALFSSESTTSVIYHLKHQHKLEDFRYQAALSNPFSMAKGTTNPTSYLGGRRSVFNDLQFKDDFIDWVIDLDLTFRQVTHQRTHEIFTNHLEDIGKILPKSPSALSNWIKEKWVGDAGRRVWLMEKLHVATSKIHISVDAWTSEEGTNYLAVVAHFLDESHKLQTALLDLPPLKGPHSGENLAKALSKVIDFYDISTVIGFFMMDNAGNNDTCIQELAKQYPAIKLQSRLRCVGHMLNLIVKALLFGQGVSKMEQQLRGASDEERFEIWRKQSFIGKLHNFCVWVNRSDQRRELLKQYVLTAYDEGSIECLYTRVLVDGGIRWNSAYAMIERALKLRHAIDLFFLNYNHIGKEYDISQDMLTPQDWIDLEHFLGILKPFKDLTKRMEGRANKAGLEGSHGSLYETIESLDVLFKELQEAGKFADNHPEVVSTYYSYAIDTARVKLEEYFGLTDATPAYRCAVALHPANKFTYFELEWSHNKQWISEAKRVVREVYAQYEEAAAKTGTIGAQPQEKVIDDNDVALDPLQQARKRRQRLAATAASGSRGNKRIKLTSELDEFMARANKADVEVEDPLEWWVCHASDYPILSKMAFDLFSCPAMSAECERVFSQTKKVITDERNRLKSDTVAALECQKHLLRTGMLP